MHTKHKTYNVQLVSAEFKKFEKFYSKNAQNFTLTGKFSSCKKTINILLLLHRKQTFLRKQHFHLTVNNSVTKY